jgi:HAD superfamily hydrolase (TIGR01509 family)
MSKIPIKIILFDVGNVIIQASHEATFWYLVKNYGLPLTTAKHFYENPDYADFARGQMTGHEFYSRIIKKLSVDMTYEQIVVAHHLQMHAVDYRVVSMMRCLLQKDFRLGFATSTNEWQNLRERELIQLDQFSSICFRSNEFGCLKTDPEFFPQCIDKLSTPAEQILLIDDSSGNLEFAERAGLQTVLYLNPTMLLKDLFNFSLIRE